MHKAKKILLSFLIFTFISVICYVLFFRLKITDISSLKTFLQSTGPLAKICYLCIITLLLSIFCFVPLVNSSLIVLGIVLFGSKATFLLCLISNFISSTILYFVGKLFSNYFDTRYQNNPKYTETKKKLQRKSIFLLPILYLIPGLPDESLSLIAGITKTNYLYLTIVNLIYHSIELGAFCFFGSGIIDWSSLRVIDWFIVINLLIIDIYLLSKLEKFLDKAQSKDE